jgi:hypothetical protein
VFGMTSPHHHAEGHEHSGGHDHSGGECDTTGRHGMLLFGDGPLYLSHLPMYDCPHNVQGVFEVELDDAAASTLRRDRAGNADGMYTVDPTEFPIAELNPASSGGPVRTSLEATLVRGHFERGGTPIADTHIEIRRVVWYRTLDIDAQAQSGERLSYLCFGRPGRLYLAHELKARPSFDQVLAVRMLPGTVRTQLGDSLDEDVLKFGFDEAQRVDLARDDRVDQRLRAGDRVTAAFNLTQSLNGVRGFTVSFEVERQLYLEIKELA